MLTQRGATLLEKIGVIPEGLSGENLAGFLRAYEVKCPVDGCGKVIRSVVQVQRKGKYGQIYEYLRLRHNVKNAATKDHRKYCYVKVPAVELPT